MAGPSDVSDRAVAANTILIDSPACHVYSLQVSLAAAKADSEAREGELSALHTNLSSRDSEAQALCLELKRHADLLAGSKSQLASAQAALTASQHDARVRRWGTSHSLAPS